MCIIRRLHITSLRHTLSNYYTHDIVLQGRRSQVRFPMISPHFTIYLILPAALWPWAASNISASNRNECQESSWGVTAICGAIAQKTVGASLSHNPTGHHGLLLGQVLAFMSEISKYIPITGRGGLWGCQILRIPHCLDSRLTDGDKFVRLTHQPPSTPQKQYFFASGTNLY
jgi:hypothetical protein